MKRHLLPLVTSLGLMAVILFASPPPASAQANSYTVSATEGWQDSGIVIPVNHSFRIDYSYGTWTVDYRNFPHVDAEGYSSDVDRQIWPHCKFHSGAPYGYLLLRAGGRPILVGNGGGGAIVNDTGKDVGLSFRINDQDQCLVDNAGGVTVTVTSFGGVG
jgi:hypothetical protein